MTSHAAPRARASEQRVASGSNVTPVHSIMAAMLIRRVEKAGAAQHHHPNIIITRALRSCAGPIKR